MMSLSSNVTDTNATQGNATNTDVPASSEEPAGSNAWIWILVVLGLALAGAGVFFVIKRKNAQNGEGYSKVHA